MGVLVLCCVGFFVVLQIVCGLLLGMGLGWLVGQLGIVCGGLRCGGSISIDRPVQVCDDRVSVCACESAYVCDGGFETVACR